MISPDIGISSFIRSKQAHHISWHSFIGVYLYNIADPDVHGLNISDDAGVAIQALVQFRVQQFVSLAALPVFIRFLDHRNSQDKKQRRQITQEKADPKGIEELRYANNQEEEVEEVLELIKQHNWNKGDKTVLLIIYFIIRYASEYIIKVVEFY